MSVPYEADPVEIVVHDALPETVAIRFPARAWITKVVVNQVDGSPMSFSVDLFNHADALEGTQTSASADTGGRVPEGNRKVSKTLASDSPGVLEYFSEFETGGAGLTFVNKDTTPNGRPVGRLYLRITPGAGQVGEARFMVSVGGLSALD